MLWYKSDTEAIKRTGSDVQEGTFLTPDHTDVTTPRPETASAERVDTPAPGAPRRARSAR